MENHIAIIKNGKVDKIIVASDDYANTLAEQTVNVTGLGIKNGDLFDGLNFTPKIKSIEEIESENRIWRNNELVSTDNIAQTPDYPNRDAWLTYRQELRDWPSTADFPNTKPTKPE